MKTKLTLSVEQTTVAKMKRLAAQKNTSVSRMFEEWSEKMAKAPKQSISDSLKGKWKTPQNTVADPRLDYLLKKHAGK